LLGDLRDQLLHLGKIGLLPAVGQDTGSELQDNSRRILQQLASHDAQGKECGGKRKLNP
jgi:hypothetical protein